MKFLTWYRSYDGDGRSGWRIRRLKSWIGSERLATNADGKTNLSWEFTELFSQITSLTSRTAPDDENSSQQVQTSIRTLTVESRLTSIHQVGNSCRISIISSTRRIMTSVYGTMNCSSYLNFKYQSDIFNSVNNR
jgi:hypothetical protein